LSGEYRGLAGANDVVRSMGFFPIGYRTVVNLAIAIALRSRRLR
jgi:hypothetical protein